MGVASTLMVSALLAEVWPLVGLPLLIASGLLVMWYRATWLE